MRINLNSIFGLIAVFLLLQIGINAQVKPEDFGIGMFASSYEFQGDLGSDYFEFTSVQDGGGVSLFYTLNKNIDLDLTLKSGKVKYCKDDVFVKANLINTNLDLKFKFYNGKVFRQDGFVRPYVLLGIGNSKIRSEGVNLANETFKKELSSLSLGFGVGVRFDVSETMSVVLQSRQYKPMNADFDGNQGKDAFLEHSIGLVFRPAAVLDKDGDGISDSRDHCNDTPEGVLVDNFGCPLDTDEDGLADYLDPLPMLAGDPETMNGIPDKDMDGVADMNDYCPEDSASVLTFGCPDQDEDGIVDLYDLCPDSEPDELVNYKGCARDWDRDSVPDKNDLCPHQPGPVSNDGCPEITIESRLLADQSVSKIQFEFNKTELTEDSKAYLDSIASTLLDNEYISLVITGHTDDRGKDDVNQRISQQRAQASLDYLVSKGVKADRLMAIGRGESDAIASNSSESGRAENRRVELDFFISDP